MDSSAYFDKLGAGEVTTRIQNDTHLVRWAHLSGAAS